MRLFYSPRYSVELPGHVFAASKFSKAAAELMKRRLALPEDFVEPEPATAEELALVHSPAWIAKVLENRLDAAERALVELPCTPDVVLAHRLHASGTVLACAEALACGLGLHVGGGSHHAFEDRGEGYCFFNDLALGVRRMLADGRIRRALIVDLDVHQGNGTAAIFARDPRVYTLSIHQSRNYPAVKPPSTLDIGLEDGTGDEEYLEELRRALPRALEQHEPELVLYQAGVDPYEGDQLGGLRLTENGLRERDRFVFRESFRLETPVAVALGGGYAPDASTTARLHANTLEEGLAAHRRQWPRRLALPGDMR